MPQILDQSEIDALLSAVDQGSVGAESEVVAAPGGPKAASPARGNQVRPYDFKRPERVSKEQMRSLESLHETFSRNFGASLSGYLRTIVEVNIISIEQMTYSEFLQLLPNPTCMNLLSCKPLEGSLILEINPLIIFPIIDRLLGGGNEAAFIPDRALSAIETVLVNRIIQRSLDCLREAWSPVRDIDFAILHAESNPAMMSFCIPFNVIEPIMSEFSGHNWSVYSRSTDNERAREALIRHTAGTPVNVAAFLAETTISLSELMSLKPGDILSTDKPSKSELLIIVNGRPKFRGKPGQFRGHKAVELTRLALPQERI